MRRLSIFSFVLLAGCGGGESPAPASPDAGNDAPADAKPGVDAFVYDGSVYPEITCGPGPYVDLPLNVVGQTLGARSKKQPYQQLSVSMSACPEVKGKTDTEGYATLRLTVGKAVSIKFEGAGWLPTRWFEITPQPWTEPPLHTIVDESVKGSLPGLAGDKGVVLVDVGAAAVGTCTTADGVTVKVKDHPEAVVAYHADSAPFAPVADAKATTGSGIVSISGIAPGTKITLEGTKTDCEVVPNGIPGDVVVEAGVVSRAQLLVRDPAPSCGPPPWVLLSGLVTQREPTGVTGAPLEGVSISWSACPGVSAKTASDGSWSAWMSTNMPAARKYELADHFVTHIGEQKWPVDYDKVDFALRKASVWKPLMPGFDDTHAFLAVGIAAPRTGKCSAPEGVKIEIKGHPSAKIAYVDGDPPKSTGGSVTTKRGLAYVSGLTPGMLEKDAIVGSKEGCTYKLEGGIDTGRAKLEAGAFTIVSLYPTPTP